MTAQTLILPGEDAAEYRRRLAAWTADLQPCNTHEEDLVRRAVDSSWRLDRADRVWAGGLADRIATDPDEADRARTEAVLDLGRRLWADPSSPRPTGGWPDRESSAPTTGPDDPDDPFRLVNRLESTAEGCRWLLDRWAGLRRAVDDGLAWSPAETVGAIRLLGKRSEDADDDSEVLAILVACFILDRECPDPFGAPRGGPISQEQRSRREWLLARRLGEAMPRTEEQAHEVLREIIDDATAPLASLEQRHLARDEALAETRAGRQLFDDTPDAERLRRLQLRDTRALLRIVGRLREARRKGYSLPKSPPAPPPAIEPSGAGLPTRPSSSPPEGIGPGCGPASGRRGSIHLGGGTAAEMKDGPDREPREARSSGPPRSQYPCASGLAAKPTGPPAPRPRVRRSPGRFRPSSRAAIGSIALLGSLILAVFVLAALRPTAGSDAAGRPEVSAPFGDARDHIGSPSHPEAAISDHARLVGPASPTPYPQKRQNEPTEWLLSGASRVERPRWGRPADRSRGPPGREMTPSSTDRLSSEPPDRRGVAAPRALGGDGPGEWASPDGTEPGGSGLLSGGHK